MEKIDPRIDIVFKKFGAETFAAGEAKGKAEGILEVAKNMLAKGLDVEMISEITGLSVEAIKKL